MHWRCSCERRGAQFDRACGIRREHGRTRGEQRKYPLFTGECGGRVLLFWGWSCGDGRWRSSGKCGRSADEGAFANRCLEEEENGLAAAGKRNDADGNGDLPARG